MSELREYWVNELVARINKLDERVDRLEKFMDAMEKWILVPYANIQGLRKKIRKLKKEGGG